MTKSLRNSNHELLRILAMYMIVFIHANMYLGYFYNGRAYSFYNGFVNGICNIGVSCFILISGYYGIRFSFRKLIKMECMMISYSLLELIILCIAFPDRMQGAALLEQLIKSVFPVITRKYWFYSCYVCLFLLSGYIQKFIDSLKQQEFEILLALLLLLFSIFPTFCYFEIIPDNGKGLVQMLMLYMIGRYIKTYRDVRLPRKPALLIFLLFWAINGISHEIPLQIGGIYHHLCKDNSITNITMAVILFYSFKELNFHSKAINKAASCIFAVFALNNTLVSVFMEMLKSAGFNASNHIGGFLLLILFVLFILVLCLTIGSIRNIVFGLFDDNLSVFLISFCHQRKKYRQIKKVSEGA